MRKRTVIQGRRSPYPFSATVGDVARVLVQEVSLAGVVYHRDLVRRGLWQIV